MYISPSCRSAEEEFGSASGASEMSTEYNHVTLLLHQLLHPSFFHKAHPIGSIQSVGWLVGRRDCEDLQYLRHSRLRASEEEFQRLDDQILNRLLRRSFRRWLLPLSLQSSKVPHSVLATSCAHISNSTTRIQCTYVFRYQ